MKKTFSSTLKATGFASTSKKKILTTTVLAAVTGFSSVASADLSNGSLGLSIVGDLSPSCTFLGTGLPNITDVYPSCAYGVFDLTGPTGAGSYFLMGGNPAAAVTGTAPLMLDGRVQMHDTSDISLGNAYIADGRSLFMSDWDFFGAKGTNGHNGITVSANDSLINMGNWFVTWSEVPLIAMGGDGGVTEDLTAIPPVPADTGFATLACTGGVDANACELGESFTLDYTAHVPAGDPSNFGGVQYDLHLQGTIISTNNPPVATVIPLLASGNTTSTFTIDLAANVTDADGTVDSTSFQTTYTGSRSPAPTLTVNASGVLSYTDNLGTVTTAADTFTYTVADTLGDRSISYTVEVTLVQGNISPVAQPIAVTTDKDISIPVDVVASVSDDVSVDPTSVQASNPVNGAITSVDPSSGVVTFAPTPGFTGAASFDYTVDDNDASPATSNTAKVSITVNDPPVADNATVSVDRNSFVVIDVVALPNTQDLDGQLDATSVLATDGVYGTSSPDTVNGKITYTPTGVFTGQDQFTYTIKDNDGAISNDGTITVNINNALPVADNKAATMDTSIETFVNVATSGSDSDGTINVASVLITTDPVNGLATVDAAGIITYEPALGYVGGDSLQYTIDDNDGATSAPATVTLTVSGGTNFCQNAPMTAQSCFLRMKSGNVPANTTPVLGGGSYFSMEIQPGVQTYTEIAVLNSLQLNAVQPATTVAPIVPNIDQPWLFVGNLGVHQTVSPVTVTSDDGAGNATLDFSGWTVSWNGIAEIPMGSGLDNGIASLTCFSDDVITQTQGDCSAGNAFILEYNATVPVGDASGFGGVKYALYLEGIIAETGTIFSPAVPPNTTDIEAIDGTGAPITVQPGSVATSVNNLTGSGLFPADIGVNDPQMNPDNGQQCQGGCVDFIVTGFSGDYVDIIYHLSSPIELGSIYRKLIDGSWRTFSTSGGDQLGSNADVAGSCTNDEFSPGLVPGNQCIFLRIYDGGPNDADGVKNGTIVDPSGVLVTGSANTPAGTSSGCSISTTDVGLMERADWFIVGGFIVWFGLMSYRRKNMMS